MMPAPSSSREAQVEQRAGGVVHPAQQHALVAHIPHPGVEQARAARATSGVTDCAAFTCVWMAS